MSVDISNHGSLRAITVPARSKDYIVPSLPSRQMANIKSQGRVLCVPARATTMYDSLHASHPDVKRSSIHVPTRAYLEQVANFTFIEMNAEDVDTSSSRDSRAQLALLLPAHNEELIIAMTIKSAIAAGQPKENIYVVNDASTDDTESIALELLGPDQVLTVKKSGKALAMQQAIAHFEIEKSYIWLHVADADSVFSPDYFTQYRRKLDASKYAIALGFVQSLRGNWISTYRALTYTYSQHITRRVQSYLGMISVFPGPITCFRTDIIKDLEFGGSSMTEDFDITLQVHRKKLGSIVFIPKAINYTQDPQTLSDFCKQNLRWQRGFFQGVKKYRIGLQRQKIDISLGYQMFQTVLFLMQMLILIPFLVVATGSWMVVPVLIAADIVVNGLIALWASVAAKRWMLIGALPYFHFLRSIETGIYFIAFVEVMVLGRFQDSVAGWATAGRRYKLSQNALIDIAK